MMSYFAVLGAFGTFFGYTILIQPTHLFFDRAIVSLVTKQLSICFYLFIF